MATPSLMHFDSLKLSHFSTVVTTTSASCFSPFQSLSFSSQNDTRFASSQYSPSRRNKWLCGYKKRHQIIDNLRDGDMNEIQMFGSDEEVKTQIPTQAQSLVEGSGAVMVSEYKPAPDVDYLQSIVILGTNAAVIRGALRAEKPELLTVILPQSLKKQPPESQELLSKVKNVIEKPHNDHLPLIEASRLCNMDIISQVQQVICFAFHDSRLLMETCQEAKNMRKIVTLFYLD
ncbi:unnamed protein product [Fraxinus pennsylvanica]|uniref:Uncharacterized protein n=1 Tax=Fraxinus pennsylvanica TaxID=56036 RepID=A0AAD1ZVH2_9LAMI|nr:unnamed protein product [Fraxinus pennsylvanica]